MLLPASYTTALSNTVTGRFDIESAEVVVISIQRGHLGGDNENNEIGFEGTSPFMGNHLLGTSVTAANFPCSFYLCSLGWTNPYYLPQQVDDSLDYASYSTYGCTFYESDLYNGYWVYTTEPAGWWFCHMRVFGNGDLTLAY